MSLMMHVWTKSKSNGVGANYPLAPGGSGCNEQPGQSGEVFVGANIEDPDQTILVAYSEAGSVRVRILGGVRRSARRP